MYQSDEAEFRLLYRDLCLSTGRKFSEEELRVYMLDLRDVPLREVQRMATKLRIAGKDKFKSADLRPPPDDGQSNTPAHDNHHLLNLLQEYVNRHLWLRLTPWQRVKPATFVFASDRPVRLMIEPDGDAPGHTITVEDAMADVLPAMPVGVNQWGEVDGGDFNDAAAATALLQRGAP